MKKYVISGATVVFLIGLGFFFFTKNRSNTLITTNTSKKQSYVALGDSVAAGVGLPTASDSSACDRTNESYPSQLAIMKNYSLKNIACSGATFPAGILGEQDVNQLKIALQLNQLFSLPRPDIITLTAGANDVHWAENIMKCYTGTCGSATETAAINESIKTVGADLQKTLSQIQSHYGSSIPKVIVTGYYQVFPTSTLGCIDLLGISQSELNWGRQQQTSLNDTIKNVAGEFTFTTFAPIDFSGHELCTSTQWVQSLTDAAPFHPTQSGQQAIAQQIAKISLP